MTSLRRSVIAFMLAGSLAVTVAGSGIDPKNPPQGLFSDEWMVIQMQGMNAGYAHSTMSRAGDEITTRVMTVISIKRTDLPIEVSVMEASVETLDGKPVSFENVMSIGASQTTTRGRIVDGDVVLETNQFGMTQKDRFAYPKGALMAWGLYAEQLRRGLEEGQTYELDTYLPSMDPRSVTKMGITVGAEETIDLLGTSVTGRQVKLTASLPIGAIETMTWVTPEGDVLKAKVVLAGLQLEMLRADKETATKDVDPPELFMATLVDVKHQIDTKKARSLHYRLSLKDAGGDVPTLPVTGMQQPGKSDAAGLELVVTRADHEALKAAEPVATGDDMAEFLEPNLWINSDDPQVRSMAAEAAGEATGLYDKADRLRRYVTTVIKEKNLGVGFASASEVCRNKEGDCSEHAVLLAALGRSLGIPSRVAMGLVYVPWFENASDVFGFHMWTQFYLAGQWVDFDAAMRESDCNPTHIAIGTSSLRNTALADMAFGLLSVIGRLQIEILSAEPPDAVTAK